MMKIAHCIWSFVSGGTENMLIDIANSQARSNEVALIIVNREYEQILLDRISKGVKVILINRKPGSKNPFAFSKFYTAIAKFAPDIIHAHNQDLLPLLKPLALSSRKLFFTAHRMDVPVKNIPASCHTIAISDAVGSDLSARGCRSKITVVKNGIDISLLSRKQTYRDATIEAPFRIVQVGRLIVADKGQDLLLEAVSMLSRKGFSVTADFIGGGESEDALRRMARQLGIEEAVRFLGSLPRENIYVALPSYDLLCQPSRSEGFGLTAAEGMGSGVPVLVSDTGGLPEIVQNGALGAMFKTGNATDLADKIEEIIRSYDIAAHKAQAARDFVRENFSTERLAQKYRSLYESCAD